MKIFLQRPGERGTILLVVMMLLAVMCVFMLCTTEALFSLKKELRLIEKKQLQRYEKTPLRPRAPQ
jgi:hypothetical protein